MNLSVKCLVRHVAAAFLILLFGDQLRAQDESTAPAAQPESDTATAAEVDDDSAETTTPFTVPEGDIAELLAFIKKVQTSRPPADMQTPAGTEQWLRFQVAAVLEASDRIESQNPDEETQLNLIMQRISAYRALGQVDDSAVQKLKQLFESLQDDKRPEVRRMVAGYQLSSAARGFLGMSEEEQNSLIRDLFSYIDDFGIDQTSYSLASQLGEVLERIQNPEAAARVYKRLGQELKKMGEPRLAPEIERYEAMARRLNLPGNVMEITGTTADGEEFDWASYRGKVVLVDFWATWCGPCRAQIPNMKAQLEKYGDKGFEIVGVSLDQTTQQYQAFVDSEELPWVNLMSQNENERGWDHPLVKYYGINSIPTAILVDREGKVVSMMAIGQQLNILLDQMLGSPEAESDTE